MGEVGAAKHPPYMWEAMREAGRPALGQEPAARGQEQGARCVSGVAGARPV